MCSLIQFFISNDSLEVSRMHVVLFRLHPLKKTQMIFSGNKLPLPQVVESNGLAKVLPQTVVVPTLIRTMIQQAGQVTNRPGNDPGFLQSDLPLRSPSLN